MGACTSSLGEEDALTPKLNGGKHLTCSVAPAPKSPDKPWEVEATPSTARSPSKGALLQGSDSMKVRCFKRKELEAATGKFREASLVGEGAFGKVYVGWLRTPGGSMDGLDSSAKTRRQVAIKVLDKKNGDGYQEWLTEVLILGRLQHDNLVQLIGYCSEGEDAFLVYSYAPGGSLEKALFHADEGEVLSWANRLKAAVGAADGLCYLHSHNVIHRDFKSSNVLLSEDMAALLTDFGLAKQGPAGGSPLDWIASVKGTFGYLDPSYMLTGQLSSKSDVYAFGVLLLELVTGRPIQVASGEVNVLQFARPFLREARINVKELIDPRLGDAYNESAARRLVHLARACLIESPERRPSSEELLRHLRTIQSKYGASQKTIGSSRLNRVEESPTLDLSSVEKSRLSYGSGPWVAKSIASEFDKGDDGNAGSSSASSLNSQGMDSPGNGSSTGAFLLGRTESSQSSGNYSAGSSARSTPGGSQIASPVNLSLNGRSPLGRTALSQSDGECSPGQSLSRFTAVHPLLGISVEDDFLYARSDTEASNGLAIILGTGR